MANYKGMYFHLFSKVTDVIAQLQEAQAETEKMFIEQDDPKIIVLEKPDEDGPDKDQ